MSKSSSIEKYMADQLNAIRSRNGLDKLTLELNLNESSEEHSDWMLRTDTFSHTGQGGSSATERMRDAGFDLSGSWATGENLALRSLSSPDGLQDEVDAMLRDLMNSPGHRANILDERWTHLGIGIEIGEYDGFTVAMATQNFARTDGRTRDEGSGGGGGGGGGGGSTNQDVSMARDQVTLGGGDNTVNARGGDDRVKLGAGDDKGMGAGGDDTLVGGRGDDVLRGDSGKDHTIGGPGSDKLIGSRGNDVLKGGAGNDKAFGGGGRDKIAGGGGKDVIKAGGGADNARGGGGNDKVFGGGGKDKLHGNGGHDVLVGGKGRDAIQGGGGDDRLKGKGGPDKLAGGKGDDTLAGGGGGDRFIFKRGDDVDVIRDFGGRDTLKLDADLLNNGRQLSNYASDRGDDLVLSFGNGDRLIFLDIDTPREIDVDFI